MFDFGCLSGKKIAYATLGCKLNFAETSSIANELKKYGAVNVAAGESADVCIVNTCTVTEVADRKGRQAIHKIIRQHPGALVVVTGCYAQLRHEDIAQIPGVDIVVGAEYKKQVVPMILMAMGQKETHISQQDNGDDKLFFPACSKGDRTRYFLKVQDGCNYFCTYCTIPFARGRSRNGSIDDIMWQVREVEKSGGQEIVITGVNIGDFGRSTGEHLIDLLRQMDEVKGIQRFRISSIEPNLLTDEIIDFCAHSRAFMPHFHIPLQSGSDEVLKLMHRKYDTVFFRDKITHIKSLIPHAFIGVDVMVGCRGERPEYFEQAYEFIKSLPVSQLHVFSYSERPGTKALNIPFVVSPTEKHERSQRLLALSDEKTKDFYNSFMGTVRPVLFEHSRTHRVMTGFTDNYIKVETDDNPQMYNTVQMVKLMEYNEKKEMMKGVVI
ncbi:MAG: tRNA (N(6)-L-threonylcarbamoyladenosine(37)-C(2))-methylthiotransferase MtaB [Bacteroidaceae bacterium]|nr:tRNA (N(6)-L-threonylcarbamoyladenosine(37)-C(2))-methylthiotransferase MtaB [Bacteroidaceae bacterium]